MLDNPHPSDDEADVDREIRIEKMKRELEEIVGGETFNGSLAPVPLKVEEAFLEQVLAYERAEFDTPFQPAPAAWRCNAAGGRT